MYHSCMYIHVPCSYCTVTPLCASVARLVSGVVWYSEAPRPRVARRRSSRPGRVGVCCFKLHWWIAWRARDFRLIGDWVSTEHSGRVRPLCSNIRYVASVESAEGQSGGPCGVGRARGAVAGAARDPRRNPNRDRVAGCPATERRFINQALYSSLVRSGGRARRVSGFHTRAQAVVELEVTLSRYGVCCFNM